MKTLTPSQLTKLYITLIPKITFVARCHGYAAGVHGSLARDLDIILVPWNEWAKGPEDMLRDLEVVLTGVCGWVSFVEPKSVTKPHGREAYTLILHDYKTSNPDWRKPFIDISVMPIHRPS